MRPVRDLVEGLLELAEKHEWIFDEDLGYGRNSCWECGAAYRRSEPNKGHKPGCEREALILDARAFLAEQKG